MPPGNPEPFTRRAEPRVTEPPTSARRFPSSLVRLAVALLLGSGAAWAGSHGGLPLPWLLAPMAVSAVLAARGRLDPMPAGWRRAAQLVVGSAIGLGLTPDVLAALASLAPAMVLLSLGSIAVAALLATGLRRYGPTDAATAYFSTLPAGVVEMATLAARHGADTPTVSILQALRLALTIVTVAPLVAWTAGPAPSGVAIAPAVPVDVLALAVVVAGGIAAAALFGRLDVPNAWLFAGMLAGGLAVAPGLLPTRVPDWGLSAAQLVMGTALGSRLGTLDLGHLRRLRAGVVVIFGLILANAVVGALAAWALGLPVATMVLATAPGGVAEMTITAKLTGQPYAIVAAFHAVRLVLVITAGPWLYRLVAGTPRSS
jgi:uncharacterized protein